MVEATGIFEGMKVPEECRGKFVLVIGRKVVAWSSDVKDLVRKADEQKVTPLIFHVPQERHAIAAY